MPKVNDKPEKLRPFLFHGVELSYKSEKDKEALGECPFCSRSRKLSVDIKTGMWRCLVCDEKGNIITFLRRLWDESFNSTPHKDYVKFIQERKLMDPEACKEWGLCRSFLTGNWIMPSGNDKGLLNNVYIYAMSGRKKLLLSTPTMGHGLFGTQTYNPELPRVYWCEGPWDGMALYETLLGCPDEGLKGSVLSPPGCGIFHESWCEYVKDKDNIFLYDNDHPKVNKRTDKLIEPAGLAGVKRAASVIVKSGVPHKSISYLTWGIEGYNESLPNGYDLRDALSGTENLSA
jgi:hypothetical protein